jgi:N-acetylglucosamine malate deacetylase 1
MTNLFIVAHVDDSEISCGGTIAKLVSKGEYVKVISLSKVYDGVDLSCEFGRSMNVLMSEFQYYNVETRRFNSHQNYISDIIYEKIKGFDNVFTHDCSDRHDDHRVVAEKVRRLYNGNLFTFITPLNGNESPNYFVELNESHIEKKVAALECYKSQSHRNYMQSDFIHGQAIYNGVKCGKKYAESFRIKKLINV